MKEIRLSVELVEAILNDMEKKLTGTNASLFVTIQQTAQQQLKEFNDKQVQEMMEAEIKARMEVKQEVMD